MKAVAREINTGQHHQASHTLVRVGVALSQIHLQRRFKNIVILGGVEQTLMAMQKVTSLLGKTLSESALSHCSRWCIMPHFFRDVIKAVTKQVNTGQLHQATQTLVRFLH